MIAPSLKDMPGPVYGHESLPSSWFLWMCWNLVLCAPLLRSIASLRQFLPAPETVGAACSNNAISSCYQINATRRPMGIMLVDSTVVVILPILGRAREPAGLVGWAWS